MTCGQKMVPFLYNCQIFILKKVLVLTNKRRQILPIPSAQFSIFFNDLRKTSFYRVHINP